MRTESTFQGKNRVAMTRILIGIAVAALLYIACGSQDAYAQASTGGQQSLTASDMQIKNTDLAGGILDSIVGTCTSTSTTPCPTGATRSLFGTLCYYINGGVLIFGATMFMFNFIVGVIKTAEDGEFLGRSWSPIWIPIRMVLAVGLLAPGLSGTGLSVVQEFVITDAKWGVAIATTAASAIVQGAANGSQNGLIAVQMQSSGETLKMVTSILKSEVCVAAVNVNLSSLQPSSSPPFGLNLPYLTTASDLIDNNDYLRWGNTHADTNPELGTADQCGQIELELTSKIGLKSMWYGESIADVQNGMAVARVKAIQVAAADLRPVAVQMATISSGPAYPSTSLIQAALVQAAADYDSQTIGTAQGFLRNFTKPLTDGMVASVQHDGFIALGQWFYQLARVNSALAQAANRHPVITVPQESSAVTCDYDACAATIVTETAIGRAFAKASESGLLTQIDAKVKAAVPNGFDATGARVPLAVDPGSTSGGVTGYFKAALNSGSNTVGKWAGQEIGVDPENPTHALVQLKNTGDTILDVGGVALGAMGAAKGATWLAEKATPGGRLAGLASSITSKIPSGSSGGLTDPVIFLLSMAVYALMTLGIILSLWLPIAPFVLWMGSVLGWLITVLEFVVAAPLWAAAHLAPGGDGIAGEFGQKGYLIAIEIFAKPLLMVAGFVVAFVTIDPFLRLFSWLFWNVTSTATADSSFAALFGVVVYVVVYVTLNMTFVHRLFSLIHTLPNHALGIIGADIGARNDQAEAVNADGHRTSIAAIGQIGNFHANSQEALAKRGGAGGGKPKAQDAGMPSPGNRRE